MELEELFAMGKIIGNKNEFNKHLLILRFAGFSLVCSSWKVVIYEARGWNWHSGLV